MEPLRWLSFSAFHLAWRSSWMLCDVHGLAMDAAIAAHDETTTTYTSVLEVVNSKHEATRDPCPLPLEACRCCDYARELHRCNGSLTHRPGFSSPLRGDRNSVHLSEEGYTVPRSFGWCWWAVRASVRRTRSTLHVHRWPSAMHAPSGCTVRRWPHGTRKRQCERRARRRAMLRRMHQAPPDMAAALGGRYHHGGAAGQAIGVPPWGGPTLR